MPASLHRLLRALERLLKIDLRYALTGGFFLGLIQVTSAISGLCLTVAFANLLPVETYGTYRYILAIYGLLVIAALPGLDTAVMRALSTSKDAAFGEGLRMKFRWGLLGSFAALLLAGYEYSIGNPGLAGAFLIAGIALPLMEAFGLYVSFLNGKKRFREWAVIEIMGQGLSVLALIGTMWVSNSIVAIIAAYFIPFVLLRVGAIMYLSRKSVLNVETDPGLVRYGRSLSLFQVISHVASSADQIVLYHLLGPAQVALFSLATAIPNRMQSMFRITGTLAFPRFANRTEQDIVRSLPAKMLLFGIGILALCLAYVYAAPFIFGYIFPQYLPSLIYSQIAVFFTLSAITYPFSSYLFAHKKVRDSYLVSISGFLAKISCLVILVPLYGIWGAIIGILANALMTILLAIFILIRDRNKKAV